MTEAPRISKNSARIEEYLAGENDKDEKNDWIFIASLVQSTCFFGIGDSGSNFFLASPTHYLD